MTRTVALLAAALLATVARAEPMVKVGAPAPDFTVKTLDGARLHLADMRGQVVILNFWATWCVPCRRELPLLDTFYKVVKDHGLRVFAVTTEGSAPLFALKPLFAALSITPARGISRPYAPIGGAIPTNFIIDRKGVVRYARAAAFDLEDLNRELVPLLNEQP